MEKLQSNTTSYITTIRRSIMRDAWRQFRTSPGAGFGAALRRAWANQRLMAQTIARMKQIAANNGGVLNFSPDLTRSPIRRALGSDPYARTKARRAAYITARLGW
jgi:hypothetical protein